MEWRLWGSKAGCKRGCKGGANDEGGKRPCQTCGQRAANRPGGHPPRRSEPSSPLSVASNPRLVAYLRRIENASSSCPAESCVEQTGDDLSHRGGVKSAVYRRFGVLIQTPGGCGG